MTYLLVNAVFLAVVAAVAAVAVRRRGVSRRTLLAVLITVLTLFALTAVFDTVMIAAGLFTYEAALISGVFVGLAPIEDFAYPLAAAVLLPSLWALLGTRAESRSNVGGHHD
ncbi:MAG: lycopene cyclase domain-containing protein [Cryobacterium sp.]